MSTIALSDLSRVAPLVGYPSDRKRLKERLHRVGAEPQVGTVRRGQKGNRYALADLPADLRDRCLRPPEPLENTASRSADPTLAKRYLWAAPSLRDKADRLHNLVWHMRRATHDGATMADAAASAAERFGGAPSSAERHWRAVRDRPEAEWLDALVPAYKGRVKAEIDERIVRAFIRYFGRVEQPTAQASYEWVCRDAAAGGWGKVPPLKTLQRRFEALPADQKRLMRHGERSLLDSLPHQERDRSHMLPLDSGNMDSRTWDVFVQLDDGRVIRPVVTVAQDEATNFLLSYGVTQTETGAQYRNVIGEVFSTYGIFDKFRFDNTRAAANKALTAGAKHRYRFKDDGIVDGLLKRLGCEVAFTQPYNGRAKPVERAFADLKERTEKDPRLAGAYTGRSPLEKPANYGSRAVPLSLFMQVLAEGVEEYNTRSGRRSAVAFGTSYKAVFEAGLQKKPVRKLTAAQLRLFSLTAQRRTVSPSGTVTVGPMPRPHRYAHPALRDHAGTEIVVRFDENDLSLPIVAETLDGRLIADAVERREAGAFDSVEAANAYRRERRTAVKATKAAAAAYERADAIEAGRVAPLVAAGARQPATEARVVKADFRRRPTSEPARAPEPEDNTDWSELSRIAELADELRRGAA